MIDHLYGSIALAIGTAFGVSLTALPQSVKHADNVMLATERRDLDAASCVAGGERPGTGGERREGRQVTDKCFYFGCWNTAGHYLVGPGGSRCDLTNERAYQLSRDLDSRFAPRMLRGQPCWLAQAPSCDVDRAGFWAHFNAEEFPQGQFLRHRHDGFTLIQWWDRNQGDTRSACNSTILLEGEHTTEEMLAALAKHFPHVLANLNRAGVELVEVPKP